MSKIKSAVSRGSSFYCSVNESCFEMNCITNYEFIETILPASLDNSLADTKICLVKNLIVLNILEILPEVIFMMLLVIVNIDTEPCNFLAWGPNKFIRIWYEASRC